MDHPNNVYAVSREHGSYQLWDVCQLSQEHHLPSQSATGVVLERPKGFGDRHTSQTTWEEIEGNTSGKRRAPQMSAVRTNKACKVCTKKSLHLTVFQPQFLQGVKDGWHLHTSYVHYQLNCIHCSQAISSNFLWIGKTSKLSGKTNL